MRVCLKRLGPWIWLLAAASLPRPALADPGTSSSALPGIVHLGTPVTEQRELAFAADTGYGLTEAQHGEGLHHRLDLSLAGAIGITRFLAIGGRFDGRYDRHPADARGVDDGWVGDPRLYVRTGTALGPTLALGAELSLWVPGGKAPSLDFAASTLDAKAQLAWSPNARFTLAALGGYRFDNSQHSVPRNATLRAGDRLALELSDFDAILLGLGASQRWGPTELLLELSGDWLLGAHAPDFTTSPVRADVGLRYQISRRLALQVDAAVTLSARPSAALAAFYVPVEPRFGVEVGVRYAFVAAPQPPPSAAPVVQPVPQITIPPAPSRATLRGRVLDAAGAPVADAELEADVADVQRNTRSGADGSFELAELPTGHAQLTITGAGLAQTSHELDLAAGNVTHDLTVTRAAPKGQLRGIIRSFAGKPLAAIVRIAQLQRSVVADAAGYFELDMPPGDYTVSIELPGYRSQERKVSVENNGVTLLNAELHGR